MKANWIPFVCFGFMVAGITYALKKPELADSPETPQGIREDKASHLAANGTPTAESVAASSTVLPAMVPSSARPPPPPRRNDASTSSGSLRRVNTVPPWAQDVVSAGIAKSAEFTEKYRIAFQLAIPQFYADYLQQLGATEEQKHRFVEIMAKWRDEWVDIRDAAAKEGVSLTSEGLKTMDERNLAARDEALRVLLGSNAPATLQEYRNTLAQRDMVSAVAAPSFANGDPLTQSQGLQLVQLITDMKIEVRTDGGVVTAPSAADYEAFFVRVSGFLSGGQLAVLRDTVARLRLTEERVRGPLAPKK